MGDKNPTQLVAEHYPRFLDLLANDRSLPKYVQREFEDFLKCGILDHGFLRVRWLVAFSWSLLRPVPRH